MVMIVPIEITLVGITIDVIPVYVPHILTVDMPNDRFGVTIKVKDKNSIHSSMILV